MNRRHNAIQRVGIVLSIALGTALLVGSSGLPPIAAFYPEPAAAQQIRLRPDGVWQQIYERLPDLPLENQYVSVETGKVASDNTLVGRIIRYHIYVKGRLPFYRLDWKITLADYLGVNQTIEEPSYPSRATLRKSPMEGDIAAVRRLTLAQRTALVQALTDAFAAQMPKPRVSAPQPTSATPTPSPSPIAKPARGPGAADLLRP